MKIKNICIGNLSKCTKFKLNETFSISDMFGTDSFGHIETDSIPYKENAVLLEVTERGYVDLDSINSFIDKIKVNKCLTKKGFKLNGLVLPIGPHGEGTIFVEHGSLTKVEMDLKDKSIKQLKKAFNKSIK